MMETSVSIKSSLFLDTVLCQRNCDPPVSRRKWQETDLIAPGAVQITEQAPVVVDHAIQNMELCHFTAHRWSSQRHTRGTGPSSSLGPSATCPPSTLLAALVHSGPDSPWRGRTERSAQRGIKRNHRPAQQRFCALWQMGYAEAVCQQKDLEGEEKKNSTCLLACKGITALEQCSSKGWWSFFLFPGLKVPLASACSASRWVVYAPFASAAAPGGEFSPNHWASGCNAGRSKWRAAPLSLSLSLSFSPFLYSTDSLSPSQDSKLEKVPVDQSHLQSF